MRQHLALAFLLVLFIAGCKGPKETVSIEDGPGPSEVEKPKERVRPVYNAARDREMDLLHTELNVSFDFEKQHVLGEAKLKLKPYFFATNTIKLDAKGFDIHDVLWIKNDSQSVKLAYDYDQQQLSIQAPTMLHRSDTIELAINYTAKPNELPVGGSAAITSDKGLYFIDPLDEDPDKPTQIWTQGETEANSRWFPTIDSPNERMTQELYITVPERFLSLSNGKLEYQIENGDGTRTDYWHHDIPHAPYLLMMAIGEFAVVKDSWNDLDVHYYVEPKYEEHARAIFANTTEMLQFYSDVLGVPYPWQKYHQVVVRDYVSGAMENTTAVIFGEFVQQTQREMLDGNNEDIVAHELFHHWFGDLVTCESWANLPLNESFATYGEYLWFEYKYGREKADKHLQNDLQNYLLESRTKQEDLIRYDHRDREDMFDSHSYAKGGRVLHMLRKTVGDEAFFASLKHYLEKHAYTAVEIHELRLSFEEVTGLDLQWFFNQWFLSQGHPTLEMRYEYDAEQGEQTVQVFQRQGDRTPIYRLPMRIDLYVNGKVEKHEVVLDKQKQTFTFPASTKPDLVNVDADKYLLCRKTDRKSVAQWQFQYANAPLYLDRAEALEACSSAMPDSIAGTVVLAALRDANPAIRIKAMQALEKFEKKPLASRPVLIDLAEGDPESDVRTQALKSLGNLFPSADLSALYKQALSDPSYQVIAQGLQNLIATDSKTGLAEARKLKGETNMDILGTLAEIFAVYADPVDNQFYLDAYPRFSGFNKVSFGNAYGSYLLNLKDDDAIVGSLPIFEDISRNGGPWWVRFYGVQTLKGFQEHYQQERNALETKMQKLEASNPDDAMAMMDLRTELESKKQYENKVEALVDQLREEETDPRLQRVLSPQQKRSEDSESKSVDN